MDLSITKPFNVDIRGVFSSLVTAGYSYKTELPVLDQALETVYDDIFRSIYTDHDMERGKRLGNTPSGAGHDKFLRFITVSFDWKLPRYMWQEVQTYHYLELNSQSSMHSIQKMELENCVLDEVDRRILAILEEYIQAYNTEENIDTKKQLFRKIKANLPEGFILGAHCLTNYAQLKTIYTQRRNHRLAEWHIFCDWIRDELPYTKELGVCGIDKKEGTIC